MTRAVAVGSLLAMLTPCSAWAKERSDKTEAQQIEQLRAMVLQLQDRVDGLERQLNERRPANTTAPTVAARTRWREAYHASPRAAPPMPMLQKSPRMFRPPQCSL